MALIKDLKILMGKDKPDDSQKPRKKILIVEDDLILQEMYADKFTLENFEVITANDGVEGLEKNETHKPDVILLDLMMPKMDGKTMLHNLRQNPEFKTLPVLVLTNAGQYENIKETKHFDGAVEFLIKSNESVDDVVTKVKRYVWQ